MKTAREAYLRAEGHHQRGDAFGQLVSLTEKQSLHRVVYTEEQLVNLLGPPARVHLNPEGPMLIYHYTQSDGRRRSAYVWLNDGNMSVGQSDHPVSGTTEAKFSPATVSNH
jgi:hypothetical protein